MPDYIRGTKRPLKRFVLLNPVFCYGWSSVDLAAIPGISAGDVSALGHLDAAGANAVANRIMVLGANSPKPARVTRKFLDAPTSQRASVSTYVAYNARSAAVTAGWSISGFQKGVRLVAPTPSRRSLSAVATLSDGTRYVFPLNQADFEKAAVALGLQNSTQITTDAEKLRLASGMSSTRPGLASIIDSGGSLTTFYSTDSADEAAAAGYTIMSDERIAFPVEAVAPPAP